MLLNLRVLTWFEGKNIITSGDFRIPLNPHAFFKNTLYLWNEIDFGIPSIYTPRLLDLLSTLTALFNMLGLSLVHAEMLAIYIIETMAMILIYKIISVLAKDNLAALIGAMFFGSNLYMVNDREATAVGWFISNLILLLPSIYFFIKGIEYRNRKYCFLGGSLAILAFSAYPNYRPYVILMGIIISIIIFYFFKNVMNVEYFMEKKLLGLYINLKPLKNMINALLIYIGGTLASALVVMYLVLSMMPFLLKHYKEMAIPVFLVKYLHISDILRLIAKWGFYEKAFGKPYVPYRDLYLYNPLFIVLSYMPLLIIVLSLIINRKNRMIVNLFTLYYLGALALIALPKIIGEELYISLFGNIVFLRAFRESFNFIYFAVFYGSIILGISVSKIYYHLKEVKDRVLAYFALCIIVFSIILSTLPLYTGAIAVNWMNPRVKGAYFSSEEYNFAQEILSDNFWSLLLPERTVYQVFNFSNAPLGLGNPHPLIFYKPYISGVGTEYVRSKCSRLIKSIYNRIAHESSCCNILSFFGVRNIIYEKKLILGAKGHANLAYLENLPCIRGKISLSTVNVYYVRNTLDIIRTADTVHLVNTVDSMLNTIESTSLNDLNHVVFYINETERDKTGDSTLHHLKTMKFALPGKISWTKISPTLYVVNVNNSKDPFILVFIASYDKYWKVYIDGKEVPEKYHFRANGFFNGWIIIPPKKNFKITIKYVLQDHLALITICSIAILISLFLIISKSNRLPLG